MGIKIHHGPDGTYKTSGAIKDDIIPVIKSGRTLITNVRGFSLEKAKKVLGKKAVHKDFKVIFIDTEKNQGRQKLARFFHWAPRGAFFVIDEVQRIFKPSWREKDLAELNYIGGPEQAAIDDRPEDIHTAWDMQRHYSWDFVFTTTSITKVRSEMKDMAKVAIRHYNIGIWRFYKTVEHGADSRGTSKSTQGTVKLFNWVPQKVFALYSSTKTGTFDNTEPRSAFYKDPKVLGLLLFLGVFWTYLLSKPAPAAIGGSGVSSVEAMQGITPETKKPIKSDHQIPTNENIIKITDNASKHVPNQQPDKGHFLNEPFLKNIFITGSVYSTKEKIYAFAAYWQGKDFSYTSTDLNDFGIKVRWVKPCKAIITYKDYAKNVYCALNKVKHYPAQQENISEA